MSIRLASLGIFAAFLSLSTPEVVAECESSVQALIRQQRSKPKDSSAILLARVAEGEIVLINGFTPQPQPTAGGWRKFTLTGLVPDALPKEFIIQVRLPDGAVVQEPIVEFICASQTCRVDLLRVGPRRSVSSTISAQSADEELPKPAPEEVRAPTPEPTAVKASPAVDRANLQIASSLTQRFEEAAKSLDISSRRMTRSAGMMDTSSRRIERSLQTADEASKRVQRSLNSIDEASKRMMQSVAVFTAAVAKMPVADPAPVQDESEGGDSESDDQASETDEKNASGGGSGAGAVAQEEGVPDDPVPSGPGGADAATVERVFEISAGEDLAAILDYDLDKGLLLRGIVIDGKHLRATIQLHDKTDWSTNGIDIADIKDDGTLTLNLSVTGNGQPAPFVGSEPYVVKITFPTVGDRVVSIKFADPPEAGDDNPKNIKTWIEDSVAAQTSYFRSDNIKSLKITGTFAHGSVSNNTVQGSLNIKIMR